MEFPDKSAGPNKPPQVGPVTVPREKKEPVIAGASKVKRPITRRFFGFILAENPKSAASRIGSDVLLPQMKMGLEAAIVAFVANMFWSNPANRPQSGMIQRATLLGQRPHTNYSAINGPQAQQQLGQHIPQEKSSGQYEDVRCPTLADAQKLLSNMLDYLNQYPVVAVADLYEFANITPALSDNAFGWSDLTGARIVPGRGGFILELPRPTLL